MDFTSGKCDECTFSSSNGCLHSLLLRHSSRASTLSEMMSSHTQFVSLMAHLTPAWDPYTFRSTLQALWSGLRWDKELLCTALVCSWCIPRVTSLLSLREQARDIMSRCTTDIRRPHSLMEAGYTMESSPLMSGVTVAAFLAVAW
jgi:hypothetical protein